MFSFETSTTGAPPEGSVAPGSAAAAASSRAAVGPGPPPSLPPPVSSASSPTEPPPRNHPSSVASLDHRGGERQRLLDGFSALSSADCSITLRSIVDLWNGIRRPTHATHASSPAGVISHLDSTRK